MPQMSYLTSPLLLGFDEIQRVLDRAGKGAGEGYPPYNIERLESSGREVQDADEYLRITLAVAGFTAAQLDISVEDRQLTIKGRQDPDDSRTFLHQGIADLST